MPLFVCVCVFKIVVFKSPSVYWLCRMIYKNHSHKLSHAPHTKTACKYLNIYQYINTAFIITTTKPSQAVRFENVNIEWTLKHSKYSHILDWRYNKKNHANDHRIVERSALRERSIWYAENIFCIDSVDLLNSVFCLFYSNFIN